MLILTILTGIVFRVNLLNLNTKKWWYYHNIYVCSKLIKNIKDRSIKLAQKVKIAKW